MQSDVSTAGADRDRGRTVEELERELAEAHRREAATAEVLRVIGSSPSNVQPVFDTIVANAAHLCDAAFSAVAMFEGGLLQLVAVNKMSPEETKAYHTVFPRSPGRHFIMGRAFVDRQPVHVADIEADPDYDPYTLATLKAAAPYRTFLGLPILRGGVPIGAIGCGRREVKPFTEAQIALVKTFADQAVIAIENTRLFEDVQARTRDLTEALEQQTATSEVLQVISSSPGELERVFQAMLAKATRLCEAKFGTLFLCEGDAYRIAATHNTPTALIEKRRDDPVIRPGPATTLYRSAKTKDAVQSADISADQAYFDRDPDRVAVAELAGYRAALSVPMLKENELVGVINIYRQEVGRFTDKQIELVTSFASQAVIAIENTRLLNELRESLKQQTATADVLKVISRSAFDLQTVLDTLVQSAARLCTADMVSILHPKEGYYHHAASFGSPPGFDDYMQTVPMKSGRDSLAGRVIQEGKAVQIADVLSDADYALTEAQRLGGFRTMLGVPLLRNGSPRGLFVLTRKTVQPFTSAQIELATTFADQAVIAIENTRLFEAEQARTKELAEALEQQTATSEVLTAISTSPGELEPVFQAMLENATRLCGAKFATLSLYDGDRFRNVAVYNVPAAFAALPLREPFRPHPNAGLAQVARTKHVVQTDDLRTQRPYLEGDPAVVAIADLAGARTIINVPMLKDSRLVGTISIFRQEVRPFTDKQIALVTNFANQAVIAVENTRLLNELRESLQQQTATAEVLKVINRSAFNLQLVLDTLVQSAAQLCEADIAVIRRPVGDAYPLAATYGLSSEQREHLQLYSNTPDRGSAYGRALIEGRTVHIPDVLADPEFNRPQAPGAIGVRTAVGVPLMRERTTIGVLMLLRRQARPFTQQQIELIETFADQAVIAIENTRLFEEVQARTRELTETVEQQTATSEILSVISSSPTDVQPVFDTIARNAVRLCAAAYAMVFRFDGTRMHLSAHHNVGPAELQVLNRQWPMEPDPRSIPARAVLERRVVHVHDALTEADNPYLATSRPLGIRTMLIVPMIKEGHPIGVVAVYRKAVAPFSDKAIELVETFADQAVIAIENARLFEEVQARNRDLIALGEVGRAVGSTLDLQVVLRTIVERAVHLSGTDAGSMFYYRAEVDRFELGETTGLDEDIVARFRKLDISAREGGLGEAIAKRQPLQISDLSQRPREVLRDAVLEAGFRASLIVPLLGAEGPLGALVLRRRQPGEFAQAVVSLMQSFADQSAIALENARLFDEIAQKSRELEIASQHKSQFVANMSHELRTPLAAILGYAELMQEGFYEPVGQKSMDALTRIRSNGKHLLGLINTVLDIAKIESGQFSLSLAEYAVENVVETVRAATESLAETKKLALKTDVAKKLPVGFGDEQRLTQVLLNLVGNAIKFTDTGEVRIAARAENSHFTVSVTDTGPGIPEEHRSRIFDQFHQVDSSNTKAKGGTGLGLAISKQIVEMHGGRIWVESTLGQGATFQMQLPIRAEFRKVTS